MNIESKDISVVVQGAINPKYIIKCLKSIRKYLPQSEIILSTWENSDVSNLYGLYDVLLLNKDPGAEVFTLDGKLQNQNRQILSTQTGINISKGKYVLKIRSDMILLGTRFLSYFGKYNERNSKYKILNSRVLINSLYTRNSLKKTKFSYLFHPSDWVMFGLREDLLNIWDIPLAPEPETSQYFKNNPDLPHDSNCLTRYHAEQYIWLTFLKKNGINIDYDNYYVYNETLKNLSELSIVNNIILLEYLKEFDIKCQKYPNRFGDDETMHPFDWFVLYKKYCNPNIVIPIKYALPYDLHLTKILMKLRNHCTYCIKNCKYIIGVPLKTLSILIDILKIIINVILYSPSVFLRLIEQTKILTKIETKY